MYDGVYKATPTGIPINRVQLQEFIDGSYILVDQLTLAKGAKPIRFFARREPASQPQ